jgi:STE24 endopeptidase
MSLFFWSLFGMYLFYTVSKIYLSLRQINFLESQDPHTPVLLNAADYATARAYALEKEQFAIYESFVELLVLVFWIRDGFSLLYSLAGFGEWHLNGLFFVLGFFAISFLIGLPFEAYQKFAIDAKYGFNRSSFKLFMQDKLKGAAIFLVLATPIFYVSALFISSFSWWWLAVFALLFTVVVLANMLYASVFAPIFNKFIPLEDGELKSEVTALAHKAGFELSGVFKIDAGKRDSRLNAYFSGFGKTKKVALFDTLIEKLTTKEILAVIAHEFGHYKHGDVFKGIASAGAMLLAFCLIFATVPGAALQSIGLIPDAYGLIVFFTIFSSIIGFFIQPLINILYKKNEFAADKFSKDFGFAEELQTSLTKLSTENKVFPRSEKLYGIFYHTHPPVIERLEALSQH